MNFPRSLRPESVIPISGIAYKRAPVVLIVRLNCIHSIFEIVNLTENIGFNLFFIKKLNTKLVDFLNICQTVIW